LSSINLPIGSHEAERSGMGGFYFGAHYPKAMAGWYEEHLGHRHLHDAVWLQEAGTTISALSP
jgi:hypothetical protein